jgi:hypothetical protein
MAVTAHRLHHARVGSTPKTLANHKSNAKAAILNVKNVPKVGTPALVRLGVVAREDRRSESPQTVIRSHALLLG